MRAQRLTEAWTFRQVGTDGWMPAIVPGGVHTDLLRLGKIPDPFLAENERAVLWVALADWEYCSTFVPDADLVREERVLLVADGLDTVAEVWLNGGLLGRAENQFRRWEWDVGACLREGENELSILFSGPSAVAGREQARRRMNGVHPAIEGAAHLRKAPCQFGWDWGPELPSIGVWKEIRLEGRSVGRLEDVHLRQEHASNGAVTVRADARVEKWDSARLDVVLTVRDPDARTACGAECTVLLGQAALEVRIDSPRLWWPNGHGDQPLYRVVVQLKRGDEEVDRREFQIGLRTIELRQEDDRWGRSFQFVVNGVPIFAKGSNWIPADVFVSRVTVDRLERLIGSAAAAHQNMLRVWGGGLYETDDFYDLCDRHGILVWQDFVFACSTYPLDEPAFLENVQAEVEENVRRLRHRACLALWCGNNEMEWFWESRGWAAHDREGELEELIRVMPALAPLKELAAGRDLLPDWRALRAAYDEFFHRTLPGWVAELDPGRPYWPSSPSSGTPFQDVDGEARGDAHYWEVWHDRKPFTAYRRTFPRFMSEFGFQSFPTIETIESYTAPEERNPTSRVMEYHQRGRHGNGLIVAQMADAFRMPVSFEDWVYLSLVLQAEGIRYGVEHWRRHMEGVAGTLYWQLDDCWPVASWSSLDSFGRWKALHYAAKRFYAPILLSVEDKPPEMGLYVSNDRREAWRGEARWSLETVCGTPLQAGEIAFVAPPLMAIRIADLDFAELLAGDADRRAVFVTELLDGDERIALSVSPFVPSKHLDLEDPGLDVEVTRRGKEVTVRLTAHSLARFVELKLAGAPETIFSDNYFDLPAGRTAAVDFPLPDRWTESGARRALVIRSLYDSYASGARAQ